MPGLLTAVVGHVFPHVRVSATVAPEAGASLGGVTVDGQYSEGDHVMEYRPPATWLTEAAGTAVQQHGSGNLLRIVLIVMFLGCALTAWILLRGYKQKDD